MIPNGQEGAALFNGISGNVQPSAANYKRILDLKSTNPDNLVLAERVEIFRIVYNVFANHLKGANKLAIAAAMATQMIIESAFCTAVTGKYNYSGIKEFNSKNPRTRCLTTEYNLSGDQLFKCKNAGDFVREGHDTQGRVYYVIFDYFRDFESLDKFIEFKINLLNTKHYAAFMVMQSPTPTDYFERVKRAGYATAPDYDKALKYCLKKYNEVVYNNKGFVKYLGQTADEPIDKTIFAK